jgi:hypothetical protein
LSAFGWLDAGARSVLPQASARAASGFSVVQKGFLAGPNWGNIRSCVIR